MILSRQHRPFQSCHRASKEVVVIINALADIAGRQLVNVPRRPGEAAMEERGVF